MVTFLASKGVAMRKRTGGKHGRLHQFSLGMVLFLAMLAAPMAAHADDNVQEPKLIVDRNNDIYGTQEAFDLVVQARTFDPMFCPEEQRDRDKAVALYVQAIAAQPGAKLNGPIADRIAQLYAFYAGKEAGKEIEVKPDRSLACHWWNRCLELTSPNQLLWAQAQMGLASMGVIRGDRISALDHYSKILDVDFAQIELPDWKVWPDGETERDQAILERELAYLRESIEGIQTRAVEKKFLVLGRISKDAALEFIQSMAAKYKGTPTGERASNMMAALLAQARRDPLALPDNFMDKYEPTTTQASAMRPQGPQGQVASKASPQATGADASGWGYWNIGVAACAVVLAALVVVGIVRNRRKNHAD